MNSRLKSISKALAPHTQSEIAKKKTAQIEEKASKANKMHWNERKHEN